MLLLKLEQLRSFEQEDAPSVASAPVPALSVEGKVKFIVGRHGLDLEELIPALEEGTHYHIPSRASFSLHEMLAFLLHRIGPAKVWLTTYGVSAGPLQQVFDMCRDHRIEALRLYTDSRVVSECPDAYQLMLAPPDNVTVKLGKNHSKVLVLLNDQHAVYVQTSANLTNNPRLEVYTVATHRALAEFTTSWIERLMDAENPFEAQ